MPALERGKQRPVATAINAVGGAPGIVQFLWSAADSAPTLRSPHVGVMDRQAPQKPVFLVTKHEVHRCRSGVEDPPFRRATARGQYA